MPVTNIKFRGFILVDNAYRNRRIILIILLISAAFRTVMEEMKAKRPLLQNSMIYQQFPICDNMIHLRLPHLCKSLTRSSAKMIIIFGFAEDCDDSLSARNKAKLVTIS